jgi:hypothetical protein
VPAKTTDIFRDHDFLVGSFQIVPDDDQPSRLENPLAPKPKRQAGVFSRNKSEKIRAMTAKIAIKIFYLFEMSIIINFIEIFPARGFF